MKFGQLIKYNKKNIFFKNHTQNMVEKLLPDTFLEIQNSAFLWINGQKFYTVFLLHGKLKLSKYTESKLQINCFYLI